VQFANDVDKASGGKLKIQVHANASLFKAPEIKRAVQGGQAQIGEILLANFQNEWQIFGTDGLPFLADSYDERLQAVARAEAGARQEARRAGDDGAVLGGVAAAGHLHQAHAQFGGRHEGPEVARLQPGDGRASPNWSARSPVTVQAAELSQAMATGVIDSYMSSGSTGFDSKTYEHIKNWYDTQAWLPKNAVIVNRAAFNALDKQTQDALLKAASDAETRGWASEPQGECRHAGKAEDQWHGRSCAPPPQLKSDMKKVGDTMIKEWTEKAGPEGQAVVDTYKKM
jgi:TRAP-type C4-dicarboxylate transport system substrate-binding protein